MRRIVKCLVLGLRISTQGMYIVVSLFGANAILDAPVMYQHTTTHIHLNRVTNGHQSMHHRPKSRIISRRLAPNTDLMRTSRHAVKSGAHHG